MYDHFPAWVAGEWSSVCITETSDLATIYINGQLVLQTEKAAGDHQHTEENILLMNTKPNPERFPMHGAMTDVNIWRGSLTETEISQWMFCEREETVGDLLLSWETAELRIKDLNTFQLARSETCLSSRQVI